MSRKVISPEIRFWSRVNKDSLLIEKMESNCWEYVPPRGYKKSRGASFNWGSNEYGYKCMEVGKASWILTYDEAIPKNKSARRRCANYRCVRPDHLFIGKRSSTSSPVVIDKDGVGWKYCTDCNRLLEFNEDNFGYGGWNGNFKPRCRSCSVKQAKASATKHWYKVLMYRAKDVEKEKGLVCDIDEEFILNLYKQQNKKCYWLGVPMIPSVIHRYPFNPSLDRINRMKGYTKDNVVLCSQFANVGRNSCSYDDFVSAIKQQPEVFGKGLWNDKR